MYCSTGDTSLRDFYIMSLPEAFEALNDNSIPAMAKQNDSPIENPISAYLKQAQISILSIPLTRKIPLKHMPEK